jgi:hypothetical protein
MRPPFAALRGCSTTSRIFRSGIRAHERTLRIPEIHWDGLIPMIQGTFDRSNSQFCRGLKGGFGAFLRSMMP